MCSRTTCTAFARAEACGKGSPAKGPEGRTVTGGEGGGDSDEADDEISDRSSSDGV